MCGVVRHLYGVSCPQTALEGPANAIDAGREVTLVVDDNIIAAPRGPDLEVVPHACGHVRVPTREKPFRHDRRGRVDEDGERLRIERLNGVLPVRVEDEDGDAPAFPDALKLGLGQPVACPASAHALDEAVVTDEAVELLICEEVIVAPVQLSGPCRPRRGGHREREPLASVGERAGDRGLSDPGGARDDDERLSDTPCHEETYLSADTASCAPAPESASEAARLASASLLSDTRPSSPRAVSAPSERLSRVRSSAKS